MKVKVYYWNREFGKDALLGATPTREEFERYYMQMCEFEDDRGDITPEDIFEVLNTNEMLQEVIQPKAAIVGHTSMSVGDILEINGEFYICRYVGWERIFK